MSRADDRYQVEANRRWMQAEMERRQKAKLAAARQKVAVDGMSPIRLPSLADGLDELQPPATRFAGGDA